MLGRVLNPLQNLSRGMARLEDGHYATRLPTPKVKELAVITNRFNTLAGALDVAREENSGLYRQLITVQEEERRDTMHSDPVIVSRALEVGATGYVLKDTSSEEVLKAFQKVREGRPYLSHDLASEVAFMEARGTTNPLKRMTVRELQTLALVAEGKPYGCDRRASACELQDRRQHLHPAESEARRATFPELMRIAIQHLPSATARPPK